MANQLINWNRLSAAASQPIPFEEQEGESEDEDEEAQRGELKPDGPERFDDEYPVPAHATLVWDPAWWTDPPRELTAYWESASSAVQQLDTADDPATAAADASYATQQAIGHLESAAATLDPAASTADYTLLVSTESLIVDLEDASSTARDR